MVGRPGFFDRNNMIEIVLPINEDGEVDGEALFDFNVWMEEQEERIRNGLPIQPPPGDDD